MSVKIKAVNRFLPINKVLSGYGRSKLMEGLLSEPHEFGRVWKAAMSFLAFLIIAIELPALDFRDI